MDFLRKKITDFFQNLLTHQFLYAIIQGGLLPLLVPLSVLPDKSLGIILCLFGCRL